ncbi:hypothetical protein FIBSPDRAFT_869753 [Athelia psychrophila]|uniref:Uncharacterized protein n=1 Tax=Athelia psychrophila TaxID=1759441 RepID=A0A166BV07_9AGAM|nr:hypothetical protein FIBSPDRAFT_869753 [Fibularhizoctonia sp. CBS 109695]
MYFHHQSTTHSPSHQPGYVPSAYEHQPGGAVYSHSAATSSAATSSPYPSLSYVDRMDSAFGYLHADGSRRSHSAGAQSPSPYSSPPNECLDSMDDAFKFLGVPQRTNVSQSGDPLVAAQPEPEPAHTQLASAPQPRDQLICGWQGCGVLVDMDLQALKAHAKEAHGARRARKRIQCGFVGCLARIQASSLCRHYEGHMVQYSCSCGMTAKSPDHFKDLHGLAGKKKKDVPKHQFTGEAKLVWVTTVAGVDFRYHPTASDAPGVV